MHEHQSDAKVTHPRQPSNSIDRAPVAPPSTYEALRTLRAPANSDTELRPEPIRIAFDPPLGIDCLVDYTWSVARIQRLSKRLRGSAVGISPLIAITRILTDSPPDEARLQVRILRPDQRPLLESVPDELDPEVLWAQLAPFSSLAAFLQASSSPEPSTFP